jgi:DNA invertase Pin-like site-specific DNA recombinase
LAGHLLTSWVLSRRSRLAASFDQQSIDTTTPAGRLMFQITGAFAEFERSMIRQRINAGLKRASDAGVKLGRPKIDPALEKRIQHVVRYTELSPARFKDF